MTNQDLIKQYVDTGLQIPEYQFNRLSNNNKKTYIRKRLISVGINHGYFQYVISDWEFNVLDANEIKQYIDNARVIQEKHFNRLPDKMKKAYLEKRLINVHSVEEDPYGERMVFFLEDWEIKSLDSKQLEKYKEECMRIATIQDSLGNFIELPDNVYDILSKQQKMKLDKIWNVG